MQINNGTFLGQTTPNPTQFYSHQAAKRNTGAKTQFATTQPMTTKMSQAKKPPTTDRNQQIMMGSSTSQPSTVKNSNQVKPQPQGFLQQQKPDSKRKTPNYYDSLVNFQQQQLQTSGHHRAATSIGMSAKFKPVSGGIVSGGAGAQWQQVNQGRTTNHSQPAGNKSGANTNSGGAAGVGGKKAASSTRNNNQKTAALNGSNFGNYVSNAKKVVQGGVTNFNVYQVVQNLNQTTIVSPD